MLITGENLSMGSILNSNGGFLRKSKGWNIEGKGKGGGNVKES